MKTPPTKEILDLLIQKFSINETQIVNFWDADDCAFGIYNIDETILIYISTFEKETNNYFLEIEYKNKENKNIENINRKSLLNLLQPILSN